MSEPSNPRTVFGPHCRFQGELHVRGDLQIDCECNGLILVDGTLEVRDSARIKGCIRAGAARISGEVEGDIVGEQGVAVIAGARVNGRIYGSRLLTAKGATLRAEVFIGPEAVADAPAWAQREEADASALSSTERPEAQHEEPLEQEREPEPASEPAAESTFAEQADLEAVDATSVQTVPTSIRAVLQRRPRVIGKGAESLRPLSIRQSA